MVDERRAERQIMGRPQVPFDTIATISGMPIKDGDAIEGVGLIEYHLRGIRNGKK